MRFLLASGPILLVLGLMVRLGWGAHRAGPAGWLAGVLLAWAAFGMTPEILLVSQLKGLLLSLFVLAVMWPALFLYHWNDQRGGIQAVANLLRDAIPDEGMCQVLVAWALSGMLEGLAGFGLPVAVVAPMLVALRVPPLRAVAAVAIGHSWAVTFGDMGVIFQTLSLIVDLNPAQMVPWAGLLLGVATAACGLAAAWTLGHQRHWPLILLLSTIMALCQYTLAAHGLLPLSACGAGLLGLLVYISFAPKPWVPAKFLSGGIKITRPALFTISSYGSLALLMATLSMVSPLRTWSQAVTWKHTFPEVQSLTGHVTPAGSGQVFRPLAHPGTLILAVACASIAFAAARGANPFPIAKRAGLATWKSAAAASVGILSMVGLSTTMEHCGMSYLLAASVAHFLGAAYPLLSPWVGILGAFATGSNNNSNVLFGSLQKNAALLLGIRPELMAAAQTAGGSLGSMLAPVKLILGCSTVGEIGKEGQILRSTVPWGLAIGLALGAVVFLLARIYHA